MEDGKEKKFWVRVSPSRARSRGAPPSVRGQARACRWDRKKTGLPLLVAGCWLLAAIVQWIGVGECVCLACLFLVHCTTMRALSSFFPSLMLLQDLERTGAVCTVRARGRNATVDSGGPGCGCWRTSEGPQQRNSRAGQSQSTKVVCK